MFWIVLVHYLRKALQIVTIARVSTMEDDAARVRVHPCYQCQNLYGSSTMFNTFKLRWFPLFAVFTPLNVWTDEGQPCDYSASCSILPAFRMCTHHYTTVGIPIFRHLIQKSIVCWDYIPSGNGLRTGKRCGLHPSAAGSSLQRLERPALRNEFRESWGEDMARDLELIHVDTK